MSHLYKIFSQQVEKYCSRSSMPDCNKNFLVTGMQKLATISNDRLDLLDPYQRDSEDMSKFIFQFQNIVILYLKLNFSNSFSNIVSIFFSVWRALAGGSRRNEQEVEDRYSGIPGKYTFFF